MGSHPYPYHHPLEASRMAAGERGREQAFYELGRRDMLAQVMALIRVRDGVRPAISDLVDAILKAAPDHPHAAWVRDNLDRLLPSPAVEGR